MLLGDVVAASDAVAATRARGEKTAILAELLAGASPDEIGTVVAILAGEPRQGRVGVGWATVGRLEVEHVDEPLLTVQDLDTLISSIAATQGAGSQQDRSDQLASFLERATPAEADFVRRLFIGELRQGANAGVVTDAVAKATGIPATVIRRGVMLSGDLPTTAEIARSGGRPAVEAIRLEVMRPIQPMLASTAKAVGEAMEGFAEASVEWKLDGIRVQVHRRGDDVRIWTRNLNEITDRLPNVAAIVRGFPADTAVLDGEVLGIDDDGEPLAFQDTVSTSSDPVPFFFDILRHDGDDLVDVELGVRRRRLEAVAGDRAIPNAMTSDPGEGVSVYEDAVGRGHEGVVVKDAASTYQAGRRGKTWRKVKPVHTFDLVVLAVEYGSGRRTGWLSNIHLGARNPADGTFVMVGKTFKGMTDEILRWQTERFRELAIDDDGRTVTVRPEQIVEVAIDGVQRSTRYPGGIALRFARVVRYRDDKPPEQADTIDTLRALRN